MPENMEINYLGKLSKNPTKNEMALKKGHYDGRFGIEGESWVAMYAKWKGIWNQHEKLLSCL